MASELHVRPRKQEKEKRRAEGHGPTVATRGGEREREKRSQVYVARDHEAHFACQA